VEQAVRIIDGYSKARAANVMIDDIGEFGQDLDESRAIAREFDVTIQSMKEPERGIRGVIKALIFSFGKHVGDESVADVMGKGSKNPAGFGEAAGGEGQAFEADHGVASPIGEPVIAGDDGSDFVARSASPGRVSDAPGWSNDELIGGEDQFGRRTGLGFRISK